MPRAEARAVAEDMVDQAGAGLAPRRLAAILAADIVGYSRLMGADEDGTLRRLQVLMDAVAAPAIAARQGRIFKRMGDAFLAEFPSAIDAVRCAAEIQATLAAQEAARPEPDRMRLRIGVHSGDVVPVGEDLLGDGVNIAARLEALAEPGGVAVTVPVAEAVRGRLPVVLQDLGEQALKNIDRPVRVYRVREGGARPVPPARRVRAWPASALLAVIGCTVAGLWWLRQGSETAPAPAGTQVNRPAAASAAPLAGGPPRLSLVVLPFANRSGDPGQEFFVDGLTESLTLDLSRLEGSFVISRNSAFTYKGRAVDVRQVGRELGVRYVVEGSVLQAGDRVRIAAQLVEAESGRQLWADSFDGARGDMLEMVDTATVRLGRTLGVRAIEFESRRVQGSANADAADYVLRGWAAINLSRDLASVTLAESHFRKAQELEPDSKGAATGLAYVATHRIASNWPINREQAERQALENLAKVFRQDPDDAAARLTQCMLMNQTGRQPEALVACQRAAASNPNLAPVYWWLALVLNFMGEPEQALVQIEKAFRLSPRDPFLASFYYCRGLVFITLGDDQRAIADFEQTIRLSPHHLQIRMLLGALYAQHGKQAEARELVAEFIRQAPQQRVSEVRAYLRALTSNARYLDSRERILEGLRRAGMPE